MALVTLEQVKIQLRINQTTEDALLNTYIKAVEKYIAKYLNRSSVPANEDIQTAALMLISGWYQNREATVDDSVRRNPAVFDLLNPYRECMGI